MGDWILTRCVSRFRRGSQAIAIFASAALLPVLLAGPLLASEGEKPVARDYSLVRAPPAPQNQTPEDAEAKSAGCVSCHTDSEARTMHPTPAVVLGCTDCHGGNPAVRGDSALPHDDPRYVAARDRAHVLPLYPAAWGWPSSANPKRSYTLLNRESPEFVRFVNPSDYRIVRQGCGACHIETVEAAERSLMATGAMFWAAAAYNNGILPMKTPLFGEAYTSLGEPAKIVSPFTEADGKLTAPAEGARRARRALPAADLAGGPARRHLPGVRARRAQHLHPVRRDRPPLPPGAIQRLEEGGRPDIRQSNRGPGTGLRVAIPILNIHKTRLNDPFMWFMGTNDQPGDYRHSGCAGCHVVYANDRDPKHSLTYAQFGRDGQSATVDPTIAGKDRERPSRSATARLHPRHPDLAVHELPHAPAQHLPELLPRLHDVGLRGRRRPDVARPGEPADPAQGASRLPDPAPPGRRRDPRGPRPQSRGRGAARPVGRPRLPEQRRRRREPGGEAHPVRRLSRPRLELPGRLQARPRGQPARRRGPCRPPDDPEKFRRAGSTGSRRRASSRARRST
jgi:hypothetical protein